MKNVMFLIIMGITVFSSCTKESSETFEHFYLRNANADLYVEINGNMASDIFIIYLHGGPGGSGVAYNSGYFTDSMEEDYAMVYLDQRGNGASQGNNSVADLTIAQNSEDIYTLAKVLRVKYGEDISIFLAGHSWGGLTSAHALIYTDIQDILKGWIEMNGAHDFPKNDVESVKMFRTIGQQEVLSGNNLFFWEPILERVNAMDTLNVTSDDSNYMNARGFEAEGMFDLSDEETSSASSYSIGSPDLSLAAALANEVVNPILNSDSDQYALTDELHNVEIPSIFLWGKYDFVVPPAIGESAFESVGTEDKELIIYESSGHSPMSNEAIQFTEDVKDFIESYK